ncbi:MAG TPA: 2-oxo-tetronate isomerase [Terriglobia bacterium]|nr:2-oxo-tetronate isomerase [Terriglobia bacterium]
MPRFAANLTMMYGEHSFLDRFAAAAKDGFRGVEYFFPYDFPASEIKARLESSGLTQVLFNAAPGNWDEGERGIASIPGRQDEFRRSIDTALDYAVKLGCARIHVLAGQSVDGIEAVRQRATYLENLAYAAALAVRHGVTVLIEAINPCDVPNYLITKQAEAHAICAEVGAPNLKVQYDFYHAQIVEGDLAAKLKQHLHGIGHIQIAGVPGRHEPDIGEINYPFLFELMDNLGYSGWVGCEYRPARGTNEGLTWIKPWLPRAD